MNSSSLLLRLAFLCVAFVPFSLRGAEPAKAPRAELKLLTVGNSFADNSLTYLPQIAEAAGKKLVLFKANLGGHSLEQHVGYLKAYEADPNDPKGSPYNKHTDPTTGEKTGGESLKTALESQKWDVVTIQQVSGQSYKPETYEPYASILIDYIKKHAPTAEIVIQETWAYGEDAIPAYNKKTGETITQQSMYDGLNAAYHKLAKAYGLRVLPVGDAFQKARAQGLVVNLPANIHANPSGEYLGAAIWFELLYGENVEKVNYTPKKVTPKVAKTLRHIAHETAQSSATAWK